MKGGSSSEEEWVFGGGGGAPYFAAPDTPTAERKVPLGNWMAGPSGDPLTGGDPPPLHSGASPPETAGKEGTNRFLEKIRVREQYPFNNRYTTQNYIEWLGGEESAFLHKYGMIEEGEVVEGELRELDSESKATCISEINQFLREKASELQGAGE